MTLKRWDGAAYQDVAAVKRWDGTSWVTAASVKRWDGSAWQTVALAGGSAVSIALSPDNVNVSTFDPEPAPLSTTLSGGTTATASGGTGPYTYAWSYVSGDTAISPTTATNAASCSWNRTLHKNSEAQAIWKVVATDSLGATSTRQVSLYFSYSTDL